MAKNKSEMLSIHSKGGGKLFIDGMVRWVNGEPMKITSGLRFIETSKEELLKESSDRLAKTLTRD